MPQKITVNGHYPEANLSPTEDSPEVIGTVKGPGETSNQYIFITSNTQAVKVGDFVYYEVQDPQSQTLQILGKISQVQLLDHIPDRIFADTEIDPSTIVALVGFTHPNPEIYAVTVEVIGYFNQKMGFINPRRAPDPGAKVFLASNRLLKSILNKRDETAIGGAHLGSLLLRDEGAVPVVLDVKEMVSTHLAILAGTGSGKSYTAGVLIEELLLPKNRAAVLIFDPHGEYHTLAEMQSHPKFFGEDGYRPKVKVLSPQEIKIRVSSLNFFDILTLLPETSDRQKSFLEKALRRTTQFNPLRWTIQDLIDAVNEADSAEDGSQGSSAAALEWKLEQIDRSPYFSNVEHLAPKDLFEPGQVTILQMHEISQEEQQVIAAAILRQANYARINTHKGKIQAGDENYLPYPVFILLEEAHRFAPAHEPSRCKQVLRTILSEGRKFGLGVGLITQRPGKLDSDILSQCMSQFLMRIVNPSDQENLRHSVEAAGRDLLQELPALSKGQVIVSGVCVNTPVLCKVRKRYTQHGGETLDILGLWQRHSQEHHQRDRLAQSAPLKPSPQPQVVDGLSID
ncbi:ATP-binding protein [Synechococcus sp. W55.1]|uniref:ATP-binding protein n=1 Tax=Synechococcus sp. W55.1 TaxID=2964512 RepID=UPI0039C244CC